MMLRHLGHKDVADRIEKATLDVIAEVSHLLIIVCVSACGYW